MTTERTQMTIPKNGDVVQIDGASYHIADVAAPNGDTRTCIVSRIGKRGQPSKRVSFVNHRAGRWYGMTRTF